MIQPIIIRNSLIIDQSFSYTPENVANKQTDLTASATKYPTVNAVNIGLGTKQNALSQASLTGVTVASDDKVLVQDTSDTNNLKTITVQSIANLAQAVPAVTTLAGNDKVLVFDTSASDDRKYVLPQEIANLSNALRTISKPLATTTIGLQQTAFYSRVDCDAPSTATTIAFELLSVPASSVIEVGVYSAGGSLLGQGTSTYTTAGVKSITITSVLLAAGSDYFLGIVCRTAVNTIAIAGTAAQATVAINRTQAGTTALPAILPAGTGTAAIPWLVLK